MSETFTPDAPTLYDVLGLPREASEPEIRLAYRRQSLRQHPDQGGEHELFLRLKEAYDTLSDPVRRKRYDRTTFVDGNPPPEADATTTPPDVPNATEKLPTEISGAERLLRAILATPDCTAAYLHSDLHPADEEGPAWCEENLLTVERHHDTHGQYTETMGLRLDLYEDMATNIPLIKAITTDSTSRWQAYLEHMDNDNTTSTTHKETDPTDSMRTIGVPPPQPLNTVHDLATTALTTQQSTTTSHKHDE